MKTTKTKPSRTKLTPKIVCQLIDPNAKARRHRSRYFSYWTIDCPVDSPFFYSHTDPGAPYDTERETWLGALGYFLEGLRDPQPAKKPLSRTEAIAALRRAARSDPRARQILAEAGIPLSA